MADLGNYRYQSTSPRLSAMEPDRSRLTIWVICLVAVAVGGAAGFYLWKSRHG